MTNQLRAYHGDPAIKTKYLLRMQTHIAADKLKQRYGYWQDGKGCAVGCTVQMNSDGHAAYEKELGIPAELAHLEDFLFEHMPVKAARKWPLRFLKAARTGADLTHVYDKWTVWNLTELLPEVSTDFPEVRGVLQRAIDDTLAGNRVNDAEREKATKAARATWATWAARAVEAVVAARAADATWAAEAAEAAWAARWARVAYVNCAADKLIELMQAAS